MENKTQEPNPCTQEDQDFVRMLFRNRRNIASIIRGVPPSWNGNDYPAEIEMAAIENEWASANKDE